MDVISPVISTAVNITNSAGPAIGDNIAIALALTIFTIIATFVISLGSRQTD